MILEILSIRDRAVDAYGRPMFFPTIGAAIRAFNDEINREDKNNPYFAHPEDYDLFHLGNFEDTTGVFTTLDRPKQVAVGAQHSQMRPTNTTAAFEAGQRSASN